VMTSCSTAIKVPIWRWRAERSPTRRTFCHGETSDLETMGALISNDKSVVVPEDNLATFAGLVGY